MESSGTFMGEVRRELPGLARPAARQRQLGLQEAALELVGHEAAAPPRPPLTEWRGSARRDPRR